MSSTLTRYRIKEVPNVIDDHLLDIIGASFNFDHVKGLSEWLKNSVDAYRRTGTPDKEQYVIFRFADGRHGDATIECIDFNGMNNDDIEKALKRWGDPEASKGGNKSLKTYGGHGNGGKFYMRQMFSTSHFITYKDGLLSVFGFSENKKYGFAEGYKDKSMSPSEALKYADLDKSYIPKEVKEKVLSGETGFTVVRGIGPSNMPNVPKVQFIINHIVSHPQSQRIISRIPTSVVYKGTLLYDRLKTEKLAPYPGFEEIEPIPIPETLIYETHHDRTEIKMANDKYPPGEIKLFTSEIALQKNGKYGEQNRIDILGELGVIGSYRLYEIGGVSYMPQSVFIYGECTCPILEDPASDSVQNDRTKLIENPMTKALLDWINVQVIDLCKRIADKEKAEQQERMKDVSSALNNFLNDWKDKFMSKILAEVLASPGTGPGTGLGGVGGTGSLPTTDNQKGKTSNPDKKENDGGGDTPKRKPRTIRVLLSGYDPDPFPPYQTLTLSPRHPAIHQRPQDTDQGVYWINTSAPLAKNILDRYEQDSPRWRDYLFQRYVDIFIKEALNGLWDQDPSEFNYANVESKINSVVLRIHEAAAQELSSFLFEERFKAGE